eukprot:scaffold524_cov390-Prasinococcus_capsulatus_cf.AAC.2
MPIMPHARTSRCPFRALAKARVLVGRLGLCATLCFQLWRPSGNRSAVPGVLQEEEEPAEVAARLGTRRAPP